MARWSLDNLPARRERCQFHLTPRWGR